MTGPYVKSAARALEILEVLARERVPMSAGQIGQALRYPKSSLSVLLRSLVAQGYLSQRPDGPSYFPTMKLSRLGDWVAGALFESDTLLPVLERLRDATQETVTLTLAEDVKMRCVHALIGTHPIALLLDDGVTFPLFGTAAGLAWLAAQDDALVRARWERWAKHVEPRRRISLATVQDGVAATRERGFAIVYESVLPDTGAIAAAMPRPAHGETVVLAVAGLATRIAAREREVIRALRRVLDGAV